MKKLKKYYSLILPLITSIGSIFALLILLFRKYEFSFNDFIDWKIVDMLFIVSAPIIIALISSKLSLKLKERERKVFIIYSHKDKEKVEIIRKELSKLGIIVFTDEKVVKIGDNIKETLKRTIRNTEKIIIILSKNTEKSEWINKEIKMVKQFNKSIFPVVVEENINVPEPLNGIKYADLIKINNETIKPLYKAIRN